MPTKKILPIKTDSKLPFSPVIRIGDQFHFSGTLPKIGQTHPISSNIREQTREVLAAVEDKLRACGLTFDDLYHVTIMLAGSMDNYVEVNKIYAEVLKDVRAMPARKCFAVAALPFNALIEIEFEAVLQH